jgi:Zn ribbon nucleic-acid-binding protein
MDPVFRMHFRSDTDGFLPRRCPACQKRFRVKLKNEGSDSVVFCAYCGYQPVPGGWHQWLTEDQKFYYDDVMARLAAYAVDMIESMGFGGPEAACMPMPAGLVVASPLPIEPNEPMRFFTFRCCGEFVKHEDSSDHLYCIACGERFDREIAAGKQAIRRGPRGRHRR